MESTTECKLMSSSILYMIINDATLVAQSSTNTALGSNVLLENAERYGLYFALARNDTVRRRQNIG